MIIDKFRRNLVWRACNWTPWHIQHLNMAAVEQHYCHRMELSSGYSCCFVFWNFRVQLSVWRPDTMAEVYRCGSTKILYLKTGQKLLFPIMKFAVPDINFQIITKQHYRHCRSQWSRAVRHEMSSLARTLGSSVQIALKARISAFILCLC
jgi:hypothetical protein